MDRFKIETKLRNIEFYRDNQYEYLVESKDKYTGIEFYEVILNVAGNNRVIKIKIPEKNLVLYTDVLHGKYFCAVNITKKIGIMFGSNYNDENILVDFKNRKALANLHGSADGPTDEYFINIIKRELNTPQDSFFNIITTFENNKDDIESFAKGYENVINKMIKNKENVKCTKTFTYQTPFVPKGLKDPDIIDFHNKTVRKIKTMPAGLEHMVNTTELIIRRYELIKDLFENHYVPPFNYFQRY